MLYARVHIYSYYIIYVYISYTHKHTYPNMKQSSDMPWSGTEFSFFFFFFLLFCRPPSPGFPRVIKMTAHTAKGIYYFFLFLFPFLAQASRVWWKSPRTRLMESTTSSTLLVIFPPFFFRIFFEQQYSFREAYLRLIIWRSHAYIDKPYVGVNRA